MPWMEACYYYSRVSWSSFLKHSFTNGRWVTYPLLSGKVTFEWRHLVPCAFVGCLLGCGFLGAFWPEFFATAVLILLLYCIANVIASVATAFRHGVHPALAGLAFATLHFGYGFGSLWGGCQALTSREFWRAFFHSHE